MARRSRSRPLTAIVQLSKIRMSEGLRRRLESEARRNGVSLSGEIVGRLEQTFEQSQLLTLDQLTENVYRALMPMLERAKELEQQAELMNATEGLIGRVQRLLAGRLIGGPDAEALRTATDKVYRAIKAIENEALIRERQMARTKGEQP